MPQPTTPRRRFLNAVGVAGMTLAGVGVATAAPPRQRNFRTHLSGDEVVPPVDTNAQGQAKFQLDRAADELRFKLNVANIDDVIGAHVHRAPPGENGSIVVFLFGNPFTDPVTVDGTLAQGTIAASDVLGPIAGDFDALLTAMRDGNAYVQVHTQENVPGEIRGQIH